MRMMLHERLHGDGPGAVVRLLLWKNKMKQFAWVEQMVLCILISVLIREFLFNKVVT